MVETRRPWWLDGGGRAAFNLGGLAYCCHKLAPAEQPRDPRVLAKLMEAAYAIFSQNSRRSAYRLMAKETLRQDEWIYLCYSYVSLPDVVEPMITMKPFESMK